MLDVTFMCPADGTIAELVSVVTNKGERQGLVCQKHGVIAWLGAGNVGALNVGGQQASFNAVAAVFTDLLPGEYAQAQSGAFKGVWAALPPGASSPVIVPTVYATYDATALASGLDPALTVTMPFTGKWRGRLSAGVWLEAPDLI